MQKKISNRVAAVLISLVVIISLLVLASWLLVPVVLKEISEMGRLLTRVVTESEFTENVAKKLPPDLWNLIKNYAGQENIQEFFMTDSFLSFAQLLFRKLVRGVWGIIAGTTSFIIGFVGLAIIILYLVFLLIDFHPESFKP